ncbi:MAG: hypothetical protein GX098_09745 [Bacteroidales bacterium]|nr:hypothetical protein [Bacteroidales bacterium]
MGSTDHEKKIIETLGTKSILKQQIFDNTRAAFQLLKDELSEISQKFNAQLHDTDPRILLEFRDHGEFGAELKIAGDLLMFNMHSNIFQFDRQHEIWKTAYIKNDVTAGYSGVINIYNFPSDSFKYSRNEDLGYLIARIFINKNNHFFVQGKRQSGFNFTTLGSKAIDRNNVYQIVLAAIRYCLDFDLLVPPYDAVKLITVGQVNQSISESRIRTGKRLGYQFRSDDIDQ